MKQILLLAIVIVLGTIWINNIKSHVKYVDMECPVCYGVEVLDFGFNDNGEQRCHCADCGTDFTFTENN